jgi:hypothetical protein
MQATAIPSKSSTQTVRNRQHREPAYQRVCDARKHPVGGLWKRNERYYAEITVEDSHTDLSNEHAERQARRMVFEPELANDDEKQGAEA